MSVTPSLISESLTPVPRPGTSAARDPPPGVVVFEGDAVPLEVPLPHADPNSAATISPISATTRARRCMAVLPRSVGRTLRERDELHEGVRPVGDGGFGAPQHPGGVS